MVVNAAFMSEVILLPVTISLGSLVDSLLRQRICESDSRTSKVSTYDAARRREESERQRETER